MPSKPPETASTSDTAPTADPAPRVAAVYISPEYTFSKQRQPAIQLLEGLGVEGDVHAGETVRHRSRVEKNPDAPNLRQVHLIASELFDEVRERGFEAGPGELGENISTHGIDLLSLPRGTRLVLGDEARIEITGLRNPCKQIDDYESGLLKIMAKKSKSGDLTRRAGVMAIVLEDGMIREGDSIEVILPDEPHLPLEVV